MVFGVVVMIALAVWIALHPRLPSLPTQWSATLRAGIEADPILEGNLLIVASMDGTLWAFDPMTGECRYRRAPAVRGIAGGLTAHEGLVYFGSDDHYVYAVEAATGETVASAATNGPVRTKPVIIGDAVYVGSDDGYLWSFRVGTLEPAGEPWNARSPIAATPAAYEDTLVFSPIRGNVYFLDATTGKHRYARVPGPVLSSPAVTLAGNVWIGNDRGDVFVIEAETLAVEHVTTLDQPVRGSIYERRGSVYVGANDGFLHIFRASPPAPLAHVSGGGSVRAQPTYDAGVLYWVSDDGVLHGSKPSGQPLSRTAIGSARISARPLAGPSSMLYVCDTAGAVRALRTSAAE
jgi:outer membrane protein assembly factor BamB